MSEKARGRKAARRRSAIRRPRAGSAPSGRRFALPAILRRWLARIAVALVVFFIVLPVGLVLLYRVLPPPVTPLMLIRLAEGQGLERHWVGWGAISPHLRQAVVAAEDNLFCTHSGFDWQSLEAAARAYAAGERAGGGSTITMQTAKNLFLWPSRSVLRKAFEVPLTALLELLWTKRRILEVYLNVVEWGPGIYGIEAAARNSFGRSAADLTAQQAGLLAAVLPNPLGWRPQPPGDYVRRRAATIRTRIGQLGPLLDCARG